MRNNEINQKNEAVIFDSLKDFYLSEIRNAGSLYSTSKKLGKSHNYVHEIVSKPKSIETLRDVYFLIYPKRKKFDKVLQNIKRKFKGEK